MLADIMLADAETSTASVIVWSCILVLLLVLGFAAVAYVKKRMRTDDDEETGAPTGFTLSDLRRLNKNGTISDEEFERAKVKIIEASKRASERAASESAPPRRLDSM